MPGTEVLLLLGGNMGEPKAEVDQAERSIARHIGRILARSRDHWTEPWGFSDPRLFLNRALLVATELDPSEILRRCLVIELEQGRVRPVKGEVVARTIDIDILLMGDRVVQQPELTLPHPRMHLRRFALAPAADLCPVARHPLLGRTLLDLLDTLPT